MLWLVLSLVVRGGEWVEGVPFVGGRGGGDWFDRSGGAGWGGGGGRIPELSGLQASLALGGNTPGFEFGFGPGDALVETAQVAGFFLLQLRRVQDGFGAGLGHGEEGVAVVEELFVLAQLRHPALDVGHALSFFGRVGRFGEGVVHGRVPVRTDCLRRTEDSFAQSAELGDIFGTTRESLQIGGADDSST